MPDGLPQSPTPQPQQALAEVLRGDYADLAAQSRSTPIEQWERKTCRACHNKTLVEILDLGLQPPANALIRPADLGKPEPRFPLRLRLCEKCGMVQLGHVIPASLLFRSYLFFTSSSRVMTEHFSQLMGEASEEYVRPGGLVLEIGSNDGSALSSIRRRDVRVLGVDPARNIAVMAASRGVPTISEFFTEPLAHEIRRVAGPASLIVACNVLGHVDDLDDVLAGVRAVLAPDGAFVVEVPYLLDLIDRAEYDTIYHEHLSYFAVRPMAHLFNRHGLRLERVKFYPVHGGTIRCTAVPGEGVSDNVREWIEKEMDRGVDRRGGYEAFTATVTDERTELRKRLEAYKAAGKKIVGYGAPAKGTVALNYCQIGTDLVPVVIDSTPAKQGWHVPGTHQLIQPPDGPAVQTADVMLLLAWNHAKEIADREQEFRRRGGKFITSHLQEF